MLETNSPMRRATMAVVVKEGILVNVRPCETTVIRLNKEASIPNAMVAITANRCIRNERQALGNVPTNVQLVIELET